MKGYCVDCGKKLMFKGTTRCSDCAGKAIDSFFDKNKIVKVVHNDNGDDTIYTTKK